MSSVSHHPNLMPEGRLIQLPECQCTREEIANVKAYILVLETALENFRAIAEDVNTYTS